MNKLLWANWARLRHYKAFWLTLAGVFLCSLFSIWSGSRTAQQLAQSGFVRTPDSCYFALATFLGGLYAVFFSLFLSAEFADGTVRNKLVVGHSRVHIYLADYLVCLAACLAFAAAWLLGGLPGLLWMGPFSMGPGEILACLLVIIGFTAAFAALFALINLLPANKAVTVVLSLAVWLGLVLAAGAFYDRLSEPEMIGGVVYADGAFQEVEPHPNPMYLAGAARTVCNLGVGISARRAGPAGAQRGGSLSPADAGLLRFVHRPCPFGGGVHLPKERLEVRGFMDCFMDCFLPVLVGTLLVAVGLLWLKVRLLQRSARQIGQAFQDRLATDTNTLIDLPSRDPCMRRLASDINAQLRLLRSQRQRYQRGDRQVKEAVTNISHDLRTPLTAICGYLELMKQEKLPPDAARYLEQIESRTLAMKGLTEELFRYSLAMSDQPPTLQPVELRRALEEALLSFYGAFAQKGIEPELVLEEPEGRFLLDGSTLGRVFGNILSNALKYSAGDLKVTLDAAGHVAFSNRAPGLDPVAVGRLFDRYYTLDTGQSSTGLGLSIARALTEEMGCAISADYADGRLTVLADFSPAREP